MTQFAQVQTLFLDAGNTLITMDYARVCNDLATLGVNCSPLQFGRAEAAARPQVSHWLHKGGSTEAHGTFLFYVSAILKGLPQDIRKGFQLEETVHRLLELVRAPGRNHELWCRPIPGVRQALEAFRHMGLTLIVVSNSDGTARRSLESVGIDHLVDDVVDSAVAGFEKPDPRLFAYALDRAGADPKTTLHVGDLYHVDVTGARAAGLEGVLIDPYNDWQNVDCLRFADITALAGKIGQDRRNR